MEVCPEAELIAFEDPATVCDGAFEIGEGVEGLVGERLVEDGPEVLGGLKLGRVWGQIDEPDPVRHDQVWRGVPAGVVEPEHEDALASRPGFAGKQRQQRGKERLGDAVRDIPEHLAGDRLDEGGDVQPLIAVMAKRDRPLAFGRPDPAQDRLQPDAVLVGRPDFDRLFPGRGAPPAGARPVVPRRNGELGLGHEAAYGGGAGERAAGREHRAARDVPDGRIVADERLDLLDAERELPAYAPGAGVERGAPRLELPARRAGDPRMDRGRGHVGRRSGWSTSSSTSGSSPPRSLEVSASSTFRYPRRL